MEDMVGEVTGVLEDTGEDEATGLELGLFVAGLDTGVDENPTGVEELAGLELTGVLPGLELGELAGELEEEPAAEELEEAGLEELGAEAEVAKVDGTTELEDETVSIDETMPVDPEDKEGDED